MIACYLITCCDGFWWRMTASSDAITAAEWINGIALVDDVDEKERPRAWSVRSGATARCDLRSGAACIASDR